jgi:hypothetical protein
MKTVIEMAREAGLPTAWISESGIVQWAQLERLIALARADERETIIAMLKGIDQTECESADGWWETSTGAEFGAGILAAIKARGNT